MAETVIRGGCWTVRFKKSSEPTERKKETKMKKKEKKSYLNQLFFLSPLSKTHPGLPWWRSG